MYNVYEHENENENLLERSLDVLEDLSFIVYRLSKTICHINLLKAQAKTNKYICLYKKYYSFYMVYRE